MIGNIQGAWTFNGNGTIANGVDITNRAVLSTAAGLTNPASPMTSSNTNGTGMAYSAGVRGTGITFDGTDDYLKQKVYYDQTGATFGPTVHGLNLSTTAAFYRAQGRDLSTYHGTDGSSTPYMLVLKDSANKTAWGYIGSTDAAETLDVEKVTNGTMEADANWSNYFSPTTNERSIEQAHLGTYSRKVITDASAEGIQSDTFTTTTGKLYKMSVWIYPTAGTLYQIGLR